jgi:hypothetical protein
MKVVSPSRSGHLIVSSRTMIAALFSPIVFERFAAGLGRADGAKFSIAPKTMKSRHAGGREITGAKDFMADVFRA